MLPAVARANTVAVGPAASVAPTVIARMATPAAPVTLVFVAVEPGAPEAQPVSLDRAALTISSATITPSAAPVPRRATAAPAVSQTPALVRVTPSAVQGFATNPVARVSAVFRAATAPVLGTMTVVPATPV